MVLRCTSKLLRALGRHGLEVEARAPSEDDWYANLLWHDGRKCLLIVHAGTLFPVFVADVRVPMLRPIGRVVGLLEGALLEEGLPVDALGALDSDDVQVAKTASRHVLGVMNEMAFESGWQIDRAGGLAHTDIEELNHSLRRGLHTKNGEYRQPLELVIGRLSPSD